MLEWLVKLVKALVDGKFTGSIQIRFKNGGISSITRPKEKNPNEIRFKTNITAD